MQLKQKILSFLTAWIDAGIISKDDTANNYKLRSINKFCLFCLFISSPYYFVFYYYELLPPFLIIFISHIFFSLVVLLNKVGKYIWSKFILILTTSLSVVCITYMLGFDSGFHLYLYTSPLFIFWLFKLEEKRNIIFAFLTYVLVYVLLFYFKIYIKPIYPVNFKIFFFDIYSLNMVFNLFLMLGLFYNYSIYYNLLSNNLLSKQKKLEEEINLRIISEENIKKLFSDLSKSYSSLESFNFIVSHNLRAPLSNIKGFLDMYDKSNQDLDTNNELIENVSLAADNLDGILSDLNVVLKSRKHLLEGKEHVKLKDIIRSIKISLNAEIEKSGAVIEEFFPEEFTVFTIKTLLNSVLFNLVHNAIKYKRENLSPHIRIISHESGSLVTIIVGDNGQGIDLIKYKDRIFGLYNRFNRNIEGKGIGLYLAKTNLQMMGGDISIESIVNEGTVFTITLKKD